VSLNHELADIFRTMAAILEIRGEPVFKSIAFTRVSRALQDMTIDVRKAVEEGTLEQVEGIGKSSRKIIEEYVRTGTSSDFDELRRSIPEGLIALLEIPGLGPKTIALLWKERGIENLASLESALREGSLAGLKGIGAKKIESIRQGIELRARSSGRVGYPVARAAADQLLGWVRGFQGVVSTEIAGSLRRRRETVGDVDLLCTTEPRVDPELVTRHFTSHPSVERVLGQGPTKASVLTRDGLQVDLRVVPADHFGAALQYFTGSKEHNVKLRGLAQDRGMTLNEWGLYELAKYERAAKETGKPPAVKPVASRTEAEVYEALGLRYVEPELREDRGEIEAAREGKLPKLIELREIRGDLHTHTTASDGAATIEQMAQAAGELGYEYLAITDHSKSQVIANGLSVERLMEHVRLIRKLDGKVGKVRLLAGCEVDILADGRLDFEDAVLAELDWVVASPHVALKQDSDKATTRLLRAIDNRFVNVIGHPTGRLIGSREGLPLDFERIYRSAAESGTGLEINAGWPRLDLDDVRARGAISHGVMLCINTDAHSTDQLSGMELGIGVARRGWVAEANVLNCLRLPKLKEWVKQKRG
jgi:DNA polymerase (family 10)